MKITKRLLTAALALLMIAALTACVGSQEDISGKYYATSCKIDGVSYSCDGEYVILEDGGTGVLMFMDEEYEIVKWTFSGEDVMFKLDDGDTFTGTYADGVMEGDFAGMDYVFDANGAPSNALASKANDAQTEEETEPETEEETEQETAQTTAQTTAASSDALAAGNLGDYYVEVVGVEHFEDIDGEPAIRIYYDFTNNSDELSYGGTLDILAKQSGFELVDTYASYEDDVAEYGNAWLYVYPGVTIRCIEELSYNPEAGGTIVVEMEDWWSDETLTFEVDAADLPGAPASSRAIETISDPSYTQGWPTEGQINDGYFKLLDAEVFEGGSYDDYDQIVRFTFEFTNTSDEETSAWMESYTYAFQDGVELETAYVWDDTDADRMYDTDIAPGETAVCAVCYGLRSDSPVELSISDLWDDTLIGMCVSVG